MTLAVVTGLVCCATLVVASNQGALAFAVTALADEIAIALCVAAATVFGVILCVNAGVVTFAEVAGAIELTIAADTDLTVGAGLVTGAAVF